METNGSMKSSRLEKLVFTSILMGIFLFPMHSGTWADQVSEDLIADPAANDWSTIAPDDWITVNKDYSSQRYVDLEHIPEENVIRPSNVHRFQEICELTIDEPSWFSSGILKIGDTLYFTTRRITFAIDAATCEQRWQFVNDESPRPATANNRGLAYLPATDEQPALLFRGTANGQMLALDPDTGVSIWVKQAADPTKNESILVAPVAADGKVFAGIATADAGVCGNVIAFDAYTGDILWRFYTVPVLFTEDGPRCDVYAGGAQWTSLSYDPTNHEVLVPVSNPFPDYFADNRPGTNMLTNSVIALDAKTTNPYGELKWFYQAVPHDVHDWDLGTAPVLYSVEQPDGTTRELLAIAGKDGFVYGVDREKLRGLDNSAPRSQALVYQVRGTNIANADVGFPDNSKLPIENAVWVCPGSVGGAQFTGPSYDPERRSLFVGMNDFCWFYFNYFGPSAPVSKPAQVVAADFLRPHAGTNVTASEEGGVQPDFNVHQPPVGYVTGFDAATGEVLWRFNAPAQVQAGTVATKSGIVFAGDTLGNLYALDAKTGDELHRIATGGAINSGLISYQVGGKQYVAAEVGGLSLNPPGFTTAPPGTPKPPPGTPPYPRPSAQLRVKIFGLGDGEAPKKIEGWPRVPLQPLEALTPGEYLYDTVCITCHGQEGQGGAYPPLRYQYHILTDVDNLTDFLETVPPPMPKLYPGLLNDDDIEDLVEYFTTLGEKKLLVKQGGYERPKSGGEYPWPEIYSVLTHPRCINCHTMRQAGEDWVVTATGNPEHLDDLLISDYPRQTDTRRPHIYGVVRGAEVTGTDDNGNPLRGNKGSAIARCTTCHLDANDNYIGVPGVPNWRLAPPEDAWESAPNVAMSGPELCELIRDFGEEGMLTHLNTDLVVWAFNPGIDVNGVPRTIPPSYVGEDGNISPEPYTHARFIALVELWMKKGMPCPEE